MRKDDKRRIAHEILVFMGLMALLFLVLRLWPVVLLFVLGIFAAALRLLFLSTKKVEVIKPAVVQTETPAAPQTEQDLLTHAYALLQRRIGDDVNTRFPGAHWVWENPNARNSLCEGEPLAILLSGAGGYKRAIVSVANLQFLGLRFDGADAVPSEKPSSDEVSEDGPDATAAPEKAAAEKPEEAKVNYEYLAFEWLDDKVRELMERCNEAARKKQDHLLIPAAELPVRESWPDISKQLLRNGFVLAMETDEGIKVNLPQ